MLPKSYCNLSFDKTVDKWDEAIPLGNGDMGALIWGEASALRFSIDKGDLWDCTNSPAVGGEYSYENIKKLVENKQSNKMWKIFDKPYYNPTPTKLPAGKIILNLNKKGNVKSFLDIARAQAVITVDDIELKSFIHSNQNIGMIKINSTDCEFEILNPEYGEVKKIDLFKLFKLNTGITQSLKNLKYESAQKSSATTKSGELQYFTQKVSDNMIYGIFMLSLKSNSETTVVYTAMLGSEKEKLIDKALLLLESSIQEGYDKAFEEHSKWWGNYWNKSFISLGDEFFEKNWYLGNYLLASCSRKGSYPMPLQGVWTADNGELPPWKGDYHHDLNTELCYCSYPKANHIEEGESFIDYLLSLKGKGEKFSKDFFGVEGLCLPAVMDIKGNALGGWCMYSLSPTNHLWLCHIIKKHYDYTGDMGYLKDKAYPYIKKSAKLIFGILKENEKGELVLPLSSSPEIHDNTMKSWLKPNSNYDLALMRCLFSELSELSEILELTDDKTIWDNALSKLSNLYTDENGSLMLNSEEKLLESHRHFSHLMSIHPLKLLKYEKADDKKIIDASICHLESLGTDAYCGYSYSWRAELYAVQRNGVKAYDTLDAFWKYFCSQNGFHLNGDYKDKGYSGMKYRPFTLEGNFCAVDALQEMLLYSEKGVIELCPAIPEKWKDISFKLRAENGILITAEIKDNLLIEVTFEAENDATFTFIYKEMRKEITLQKGEVNKFALQ